jgi:hypothetical protein
LKKLIFLALLAGPLITLAQKSVDLDRYRFSVQYRSLPVLLIDPAYRTYHVEVEGTELMNRFLAGMSPEKTVELEGWKKLERDGHLAIQVRIGDLLPESVNVRERVEQIKNRSGQVTGTRTYYRQEVVYTFEAKAAVYDYKGMHVRDELLASRAQKRTYLSPEFSVRALADGYFVVNSIAVTKELFEKSVTNAMHLLSERISDNFGFREVTANDQMWIIGSKKHPQKTAWANAFRVINEVLFSMNPSQPIDGAREQLKPAIDYFEKIKQIYNSGTRHDRKIRYAAYYNLAVLYYYLDDPNAMMKEAGGLVLNDFDPKDGRAFEATAKWLKQSFDQNKIYTRHFPVNVEAFRGPFETDAAQVEKTEL